MTAPALILWSPGGHDAVPTAHAMRWALQAKRPGIDVHLAFSDSCPPSGPQVVNTLARRGVSELVFVPLSTGHATEQWASAAAATEQIQHSHPHLAIRVARPVGPDASLLSVLDDRVRAALRREQAPGVDALILATPSKTDIRGKALIARRARQWSNHHQLPCVVASGVALDTAISHLRSQGRRNIAVGSLFLLADEEFMAAQASARRRQVVMSDVIGPDERLFDLVMSRYSVAAMRMVGVGATTAIAV